MTEHTDKPTYDELAAAVLAWRDAVDADAWGMRKPTDQHDPFIHALWNVSERLRMIGADDD